MRPPFVGCRASGNLARQTFHLSCPANHVIRIWSANVGYDPQWNPIFNPPTCSLDTASSLCWRSIFDETNITSCNGIRSCSISQAVLSLYRCVVIHRNILHIRYDCVTGT